MVGMPTKNFHSTPKHRRHRRTCVPRSPTETHAPDAYYFRYNCTFFLFSPLSFQYRFRLFIFIRGRTTICLRVTIFFPQLYVRNNIISVSVSVANKRRAVTSRPNSVYFTRATRAPPTREDRRRRAALRAPRRRSERFPEVCVSGDVARTKRTLVPAPYRTVKVSVFLRYYRVRRGWMPTACRITAFYLFPSAISTIVGRAIRDAEYEIVQHLIPSAVQMHYFTKNLNRAG